LLPNPPRSRWPTIPCICNDVARSPDGVIGLSDDHYRPPHMVNNGLRDTSPEKVAERPEPSSSENDEVDSAVARGPHELPRRLAFAHNCSIGRRASERTGAASVITTSAGVQLGTNAAVP
jgi:hypothetical protein